MLFLLRVKSCVTYIGYSVCELSSEAFRGSCARAVVIFLNQNQVSGIELEPKAYPHSIKNLFIVED